MQQNTSKTFRIDYQREPPFKFSLAAEMKSEFIIIPEISNKVALFLKNDDFHVSARFFGYMSSVVGNGCFLIQLKRGHEKKITPDKASFTIISMTLETVQACCYFENLFDSTEFYASLFFLLEVVLGGDFNLNSS